MTEQEFNEMVARQQAEYAAASDATRASNARTNAARAEQAQAFPRDYKAPVTQTTRRR